MLPTVRLQLVGLALLAVVLPLGGVLASGWVMFHMHDDAKILAVSSAAALSAVVAALLLARWILAPLDRLRAVSAELAAGDLAARAPEQGPGEVAEMGSAFNAMAESIERLFEARRELVAWASHDLRTPLASMQAMLEAIDDGLAEPDEYLPALQRPGAHPVRPRRRPLRARPDRRRRPHPGGAGGRSRSRRRARACAGSRPRPARRALPWRRGSAQDRRSLCAPDKVERVLHNLLTNALRHTPSDGAIAVVVRRAAGGRRGRRSRTRARA